MYFLGIDPGKKGGFAVLEETNPVILAHFEKDLFLEVISWLSKEQVKTRCCIEKVHAMPKQGSVSMFTFGEGFGWLKGVLDMAEISYQEIPPQKWKKEFGLNSDKQKSIEVAKQLFPKTNLVPQGGRVPSDGLAEALLMAEYARRML